MGGRLPLPSSASLRRCDVATKNLPQRADTSLCRLRLRIIIVEIGLVVEHVAPSDEQRCRFGTDVGLSHLSQCGSLRDSLYSERCSSPTSSCSPPHGPPGAIGVAPPSSVNRLRTPHPTPDAPPARCAPVVPRCVHAVVVADGSSGHACVGDRGKRSVNVLPSPSWLSAVKVPPCCSTICCATESPRPVPAICPTLLAR